MLGGVWRTINGRRVFIQEGQSLSQALKKSGKFENAQVRMHLKALETIRLEELREQYRETLNKISKLENQNKIGKIEYEEAIKEANRIFNKRKRQR